MDTTMTVPEISADLEELLEEVATEIEQDALPGGELAAVDRYLAVIRRMNARVARVEAAVTARMGMGHLDTETLRYEYGPSIDSMEPLEAAVRAAEVERAALLEAAKGVDVLYAEMQSALPAIANTPAWEIVMNTVTQARAAIAMARGEVP